MKYIAFVFIALMLLLSSMSAAAAPRSAAQAEPPLRLGMLIIPAEVQHGQKFEISTALFSTTATTATLDLTTPPGTAIVALTIRGNHLASCEQYHCRIPTDAGGVVSIQWIVQVDAHAPVGLVPFQATVRAGADGDTMTRSTRITYAPGELRPRLWLPRLQR